MNNEASNGRSTLKGKFSLQKSEVSIQYLCRKLLIRKNVLCFYIKVCNFIKKSC